MPSHAAVRPTGPTSTWIVLRYVSAFAGALPLGVAAALVFCQWNWGAGWQPGHVFPASGWVVLLALLGCAGLAPSVWAACLPGGRARMHGGIAVAASSVLALVVAGLLVCLVFAVASVSAAIALP
jgi:hypothetical protein